MKANANRKNGRRPSQARPLLSRWSAEGARGRRAGAAPSRLPCLYSGIYFFITCTLTTLSQSVAMVCLIAAS